jgi:hypothetical protein
MASFLHIFWGRKAIVTTSRSLITTIEQVSCIHPSNEKAGNFKLLANANLAIYAVPVVRPQDLAKPGQGRIQILNTKTDPLRITGIDTKFTQEVEPKFTIVLPKNVAQLEVVQVVSDTELIMKKELKDAKAIELLMSPDGCAYKCIPHVEQDSVYKSVHEELNNHQCITIFPEGGSHDRAEMLPFKGMPQLLDVIDHVLDIHTNENI